MRTKKIPLLTTFFSITLFQVSYGQSIEDLSKTVVFLCQKSFVYEIVDGQRCQVLYRRPDTKHVEPKLVKSRATGFIIKHNSRDYLVTAKHVARQFERNIAEKVVKSTVIVVNQANGKARELSFEDIRRAKVLPGAKWFYHPVADIAIHPLAYSKDVKIDLLAIKSVDCPKADKKIPLLSVVYVLGFPLGLGVQEAISPIAKETQVASKLTSVDLSNIDPSLKFILLDQALAQGYSGAPVFCVEEIKSPMKVGSWPVKAGEKMHLIGIQSQTIYDKTGGKLSLVVPISYL